MNRFSQLVLGFAVTVVAGVTLADPTNVVITSVDQNGQITWTSSLGNAEYRVEWASSLSEGRWTNSWSDLNDIHSTNAVNTKRVPMFYRVVGTHPPLFDSYEYRPSDPNVYGRRVFEYTNFVDGTFALQTNQIAGFKRVPYKTGAIIGVTNLTGDIWWNDGRTVKYLGNGDVFPSIDTNLTAYPASVVPAQVYDGMIISDAFWIVKEDLSESGYAGGKSVVQIQTVTVPAGTYSNAAIYWNLDTDKPYTTLDFHGKDAEMGITLPTSQNTQGYSVTDFTIDGRNTGPIVVGDIQAATGELRELSRLRSVSF